MHCDMPQPCAFPAHFPNRMHACIQHLRLSCRVRLNIWDVGGQATLRPYWQNYFERTDALLWVRHLLSPCSPAQTCRTPVPTWHAPTDCQRESSTSQVVDSADTERLRVCREELQQLLKEEKLAGATLLILANKQDLPGALSAAEIKKVILAAKCGRHDRGQEWCMRSLCGPDFTLASSTRYLCTCSSGDVRQKWMVWGPGHGAEGIWHAALEDFGVQCRHWRGPTDRL